MANVAAMFSQQYPEVEVEVVASDRRANLLEEGFDVAVVVAASETDSTMISRVLSSGEAWCCAAPSYLGGRSPPSVPSDLSAHDFIIREAAGDGLAWGAMLTFERGDDVQRVEVRGRLMLSSIGMTHAAALAGAGVAAIPSIICADDIKNGRLVRVWSDWVVERKDIRLIYPSNRHLSPRVRLFVDALVAAARTDERFCARETA